MQGRQYQYLRKVGWNGASNQGETNIESPSVERLATGVRGVRRGDGDFDIDY